MDIPKIKETDDPEDYEEIGNGLFVPAPISEEEWLKEAGLYRQFCEEHYTKEFMEQMEEMYFGGKEYGNS